MVNLAFCLTIWTVLLVCVYGRYDPYQMCPPQPSIDPCKCVKSCESCQAVIQCFDITFMQELNDMFVQSGNFPFRTFTIMNSRFMFVPSVSLESKQFRLLSIVNSTLSSVFDASPLESSPLQSLYLHNLTLRRGIHWELLSSLHSLKSLTVSNTEVRTIGDDFGRLMPKQVEMVHFSHTKTEELGESAFAPLSNLVALVLRNTGIRTLGRDMFPKPFRATQLDFSNNKLRSLPDDFFTDLPDLKGLILNNNNFAFVSEKVFGKAGISVRFIPLRDNPIHCDCKMKWLTSRSNMPYIDAKCLAPSAVHGKNVRELKASDFEYC